MCEHLPDRRRYVQESEADYLSRNPPERCQWRQFACRTNCDECAQALSAELVGLILAEKETSDRDLFVTLTYSDKELMRLVGNTNAAHNIDAARKHFSDYLRRFRDMLRRLHPELMFKINYFRIAEYGDEFSRVHWHGILSFYVDWKDYSDCVAVPRPQWTDDYIPNLVLDWLYIHEMETEAQEIARTGKQPRNMTALPSRIPHPYGGVRYENCRGGDARYLAVYCTKAITKQAELRRRRQKGEIVSPDDYEDLRKAWQSLKSRRRSRGYGHRFAALQGQKTAEAGLPPSTYFSIRTHSKAIPVGDCPPSLAHLAGVTGSDKRPWISFDYDESLGQTVSSVSMRRWRAVDFMLTKSIARAYLAAYDSMWVLKHRSAPPTGSVLRHRKVGGRDRQYYGYGVDEAREQLAKAADAAEEQRFLVKRRREMRKNPDAAMNLRVAEDLVVPKKQPTARTPDRQARQQMPLGPEREWASLVEVWRDKFYRDNAGSLSLGMRWDFTGNRVHREAARQWFASQPALAGWSASRVYDLRKAVLNLPDALWPKWAKGEGGNGYAILGAEPAPGR